MVAPVPEFIKQLGEKNCKVYGDLVVCISGTDRFPSLQSMLTGKRASMVKICVGRLSKPDEWFCIRVLAEPHYANKDNIINVFETDVDVEQKNGKTIFGLIDYPLAMVLAIDRAKAKERCFEYIKSGDTLLMRTLGVGEGNLKKYDFLRY